MVDVLDMPTQSFGYVPTPALVAPIEFTLRVSDYRTLGGHVEHIKPVHEIKNVDTRRVSQSPNASDPTARENYRWSKGKQE